MTIYCRTCEGRGWLSGFGGTGDPATAACPRCTGERPPAGVVGHLLHKAEVDWRSVLGVVEVGSTLHGVSDPQVAGDRDYAAVAVESWHDLIWRADRRARMARTAPEGEKSHPGDVDLTVYPLRKFVHLCLRGNPSLLVILYASGQHHLWWQPEWSDVRTRIRNDCLAVHPAAEAFSGYMDRQIERWTGRRGQKNVSRPDLIERYGYDVKYAYHAIRLGLQGAEYLSGGVINLPVLEPWRQRLFDLRSGLVLEDEALEWAREVREDLERAISTSPLRSYPDAEGLRAWIDKFYHRRFCQ